MKNRVLIYCVGKAWDEFRGYIERNNTIVGYIDNGKVGYCNDLPIAKKKDIKNFSYDYIYITLYDPEKREHIKTELISDGIQPEKIIVDILFMLAGGLTPKIEDGYLLEAFGYRFDRKKLYIECPYGIGDTLIVASFVRGLKETWAQYGKVVLITKESHREIPELFNAVDEVIVSDDLAYLFKIYSVSRQVWKLHNYLYGHFKADVSFNFYPECERNRRFMDAEGLYKKLVLDIPQNVQPEAPDIVAADKNENDCILLCPHANTLPEISADFWLKIAQILKNKGYLVYTNIGKNEVAIPETREWNRGLRETMTLAKCCRGVIALRSGLCDLLQYTCQNMIVINRSGYAEWNLGCKSKRIHDLFIEDEESEENILRLINETIKLLNLE